VRHSPTDGLRRERLANGVTLLVQRRRSAPAAALITRIGAGFLDEPDTLVGVSHVLEHMLFKGTSRLGPGELARRTKALGGSLNAHTAYERTVYHAVVPARAAAELALLQADQVRNALIDAEELRRELGVIIQEARRKLDTPSAVTGETLHELLFDQHRIRRWRIGVEERLERLTRDEVAGYYRARYVPSRAIVALVADIEESAALDMLRAAWDDWQGVAEPIPPGPVETAPPVLRARRMTSDVTMVDLVLGWRGVGALHAQEPGMEMLAGVLGSGRGARLTRMLREPGTVSSISAGHYSAGDASLGAGQATGVFAIGAELEAARLEETLAAIGGAVGELRDRGPSVAELERVRALARMRLQRRLEHYEGRAIALAEAEAQGDVTRLDRQEAELLAVTPAQIRDLAAEHLTPESVSGVALFPTGDSTPFDAERLGAAVSGAPRRAPEIAGVPAGTRGQSRISGQGNAAHGVWHLALPGLDILAARHAEATQVTIGAYRLRSEPETPGTAGLTALTLRSMLRGTSARDAAQLALAIESLGGVFSTSLTVDSLGFSTAVVPERVDVAAGLLAELLFDPRFDPVAVGTERDLLLQDALAVADDMMRFPFELAFGVAFGDTGYGVPMLGTPASIATFTPDLLRDWHRRLLTGGRTTVVVVGDAEPERLAEQVAGTFVPWHGSASPGNASRQAIAAASMHPGARVERRDRRQSALAMIFPGPRRADPARHAADTWAAIAGGLGGRLFESLRDRRSLAYTVIASAWQRRVAGALLTYIATAPERLAEAREAMLADLAVFAAEPPADEEVQRATAMLAGQAEMSRQTGGAYAGEIADAWLHGTGLEELDDPAAPWRAVTATAVHQVATAALDPARRAEGVVESQRPQ
jgi:zinc protease